MIKKGDIEKLAALSRIKIEPTALQTLLRDLDEIVKYVSQLETVEIDAVPDTIDTVSMRNVLRKDINVDEPEIYTKELLREVPVVKQNFVAVKAILRGE